MRKLASIQIIEDLQPIENADAIEVATILDWKVVVKKGEFKVGDHCIYFEIDSMLPVHAEFEFLRKGCYKNLADGTEGFRLKTIRLRGQISQGLAMPLNILKVFPNLGGFILEAGSDLTEALEVKKYEPPVPSQLQGFAKSNFPSFIRKTDQERIQNIWKKVKEKHGEEFFEITLKLDGTSATYYFNDGKFGVCSRNLDLKLEVEDIIDAVPQTTLSRNKNTYISCGISQGIFAALQKLGRNLAIQGEIIGEGIQGNPEKLIGQKLFIFDIWDIDAHRYLSPNERLHLLADMDLDAHCINHWGFAKLKAFSSIEEILSLANGPSLNASMREGLVFKSMNYLPNEVFSFKVISNEFLLKEKD